MSVEAKTLEEFILRGYPQKTTKLVRLEDTLKTIVNEGLFYSKKIKDLEARLEQMRQKIQENLDLTEIFIEEYYQGMHKDHRGIRDAKDDVIFLKELLAALEGREASS